MPEFLEQSLMDPRGYVVQGGRPKATQAAVALTDDGRCVFGDAKTARATYSKAGSRLTYYDDEVERQRRLVCDTALGQLMLDNPRFTKKTLDRVSDGVELYWAELKPQLYAKLFVHKLKTKAKVGAEASTDPFQKLVQTDGRHVSNPTSFGRLPVSDPSPAEFNRFKSTIEIWITYLRGSDVPKIMNLHDTFLRIFCSNNPGVGTPSQIAGMLQLREDWYDDKARGRDNRDKAKFAPSSLPGLVTEDFTIPWRSPLSRSGVDLDHMRVETRNRGTDMFVIQAKVMHESFKAMLAQHNLVFAASASGSTSTLLASAHTFRPGILADSESLKQYLMACVAYLVGSGMHTCHEVFYTGRLTGLNYTPGKYLAMLPSSFTVSRLYERWASEFWDLVRPDRQSPR